MKSRDHIVRQVFAASNGHIIGRIRLQKIFYLLEQLGLNGGFKFSYYHYGPYSEDVFKSVDRISFVDKAIIEVSKQTIDGNNYSVFEQIKSLDTPLDTVGSLNFDVARQKISLMKEEQSVVIELAATIHWLRFKEGYTDWKSELIKRKTSKATEINIKKAENLLVALGLI